MTTKPLISALILLATALPAVGQSRDFILEDRQRTRLNDLGNPRAPFMVRIHTDREDRIYEEGEEFNLKVLPERDCYVNVINLGPTGDVTLLFPNEDQTDNFARGQREVVIPDPDRRLGFVARPPFGQETVIVLATEEKIDLRAHGDLKRFCAEKLHAKTVPEQHEGVRNLAKEVRKGLPREGWVLEFLELRTVEKGGRRATARAPKKWVVAVGISEYEDVAIRRLNAPHRDAEAFAETLTKHSGFSVLGEVLVNERATKANIDKLLGQELPAITRAGDTVVIYWSGHGGRTADLDGDEGDGRDEYLVLYDSEEIRPSTMLLDDTFFQYLSKLEGCEVVLVLDSCHSGGLPKGNGRVGSFDMFDGELRRAKGLGKAKQVLLAASGADEQAWEMTDGKYSVMTHHLIKVITNSGRLSVAQACDGIKEDVSKYVKEKFRATQTPMLDGEGAGRIYLRGGK